MFKRKKKTKFNAKDLELNVMKDSTKLTFYDELKNEVCSVDIPTETFLKMAIVLQEHIKIKKPNPNNFVTCPTCGKKVKRKNLQKHNARSHSKTNPPTIP